LWGAVVVVEVVLVAFCCSFVVGVVVVLLLLVLLFLCCFFVVDVVAQTLIFCFTTAHRHCAAGVKSAPLHPPAAGNTATGSQRRSTPVYSWRRFRAHHP
jgi:hypothetical protein